MNKADMRKGMLLKGKIGAEEKIYRVLDLKEKVLVLDCVKKTMPVWKTYEELSDYVEKEEESMAEAIDIIDAMECRSEERRQYIVDNYDVVPVAHIQLLNGQTKHSDAGQTIENDYYIFEATSKANGKKEIIQCGMTAARDFLKKINHEGLPLFNPLHGEGGTGKKGSKTSGGNESKEVKWNPIAKQLYNAIMWVIVIIDAKPNTAIYEVKEKVWKFKSYEPFPSQVKAVNTIISKNIVGKTLTEAIDELRHDNEIRDGMCDFDMLIDIIGNYKDKEGKPVVIESKF